jgi:hypothetical protein
MSSPEKDLYPEVFAVDFNPWDFSLITTWFGFLFPSPSRGEGGRRPGEGGPGGGIPRGISDYSFS